MRFVEEETDQARARALKSEGKNKSKKRDQFGAYVCTSARKATGNDNTEHTRHTAPPPSRCSANRPAPASLGNLDLVQGYRNQT